MEGRVEPVGAPLPDVAGHVVQAEAVRRERGRPAPCRESRRRGCCRSGNVPCQTFIDARRRASARHPTESAAARARRVPRTPTRPRSEVACRPTRSTRERRSTTRGRPDGRGAPRARSAGPPDGASWRRRPAATRAPPRRRASAEVVGEQPGEDERPTEALGLGDVTGRADEASESVVGHRRCVDPERRKLDLARRALAVGGVPLASLVPIMNLPPAIRVVPSRWPAVALEAVASLIRSSWPRSDHTSPHVYRRTAMTSRVARSLAHLALFSIVLIAVTPPATAQRGRVRCLRGRRSHRSTRSSRLR